MIENKYFNQYSLNSQSQKVHYVRKANVHPDIRITGEDGNSIVVEISNG